MCDTEVTGRVAISQDALGSVVQKVDVEYVCIVSLFTYRRCFEARRPRREKEELIWTILRFAEIRDEFMKMNLT